MTPDIELQLQTIIKSLSDNVAPAVDGTNQLAQEQMHLSLAALQFTLEHLPFVHNYLRREMQNSVRLANQLMPLLVDSSGNDELNTAIERATLALNDPAKGFTDLQQESRRLRDVISEVTRVASEGEMALEVFRLVLAESGDSLNMGRSWNKSNGFEPEPDKVTDFQKLFS